MKTTRFTYSNCLLVSKNKNDYSLTLQIEDEVNGVDTIEVVYIPHNVAVEMAKEILNPSPKQHSDDDS